MPQVGQFSFNQSSQQCFYFITGISGIELMGSDIVVAYKDDKVVGAAQWVGQYTTVPVMGDEGESYTDGYCFPGDIPIFKLARDDGSLIPLTVPGGTPAWVALGQPFVVFNASAVEPEPEPTEIVSAVTVVDGQLVIFKVLPENMIV